MKAWLALLAVTLAGCEGEPEQIRFSDAQKAYLGAWEFTGSENDGADTNSMLLVFQKNGHVAYKRCIERKSKNSSGHRYSFLPDAPIKTFTDTQLTLSPGYSIFRWKMEFTVGRAPYSESRQSYIQIDGVTLRRLRPDEPSTQASWKCSTDDDKTKEENEENSRRWDRIVSESR